MLSDPFFCFEFLRESKWEGATNSANSEFRGELHQVEEVILGPRMANTGHTGQAGHVWLR